MCEVKQIPDNFCTLCGKKLSKYNTGLVCFAHLESEKFQKLVAFCDSFCSREGVAFSLILHIFLDLYNKPLMELANELQVSLATIRLWSEGKNLPALNVQKKVVRLLKNKLV